MLGKKRSVIAVAIVVICGLLLFNANSVVEAKTLSALTISAPSSAKVNQPFSITGKLTANGAQLTKYTVSLQRLSGRTWTTLASKTVIGTYSFSRTETTASTYQYRTTYTGSGSYASSTSPTATVTVKSALTPTPTPTPTPGTHQPIAAGTGPAVVFQGGDYLYLFVQGYDHALWYNREDLSNLGGPNWGWSGWTSLGGVLTSSPAAISRGDNTLDVFVRGTDGVLWQKTTTDGGTTWSNWNNLGGVLAPGTGPGVSGWSGHEDLFVVGTDSALWHNTWTASGWSGWASLGGSSLRSSPAAVSRVSGVIDVHVRGNDGTDNELSYSNGAWAAWKNLGGQIAAGTGPALGVWSFSPTGGTVYVLYTGTDGAMYQKTWTQTSGWSRSWTNLGGTLISSPSVAWTTQQYSLEVYARWTNDYLFLKEYFKGASSAADESWTDWMGGSMLGPPGVL